MSKARVYTLVFFVFLILAGGSSYYGYSETIYKVDRANALFNRAEATGFAEEFIEYVKRGREFLPAKGNPVWWFPTDRTDFTLIQSDISTIIGRAEILGTLPRNSDAYQQGMDDIRDKIRTIELQSYEAAPYIFASVANLVLSLVWFVVNAFLLVRLFKSKTRDGKK